VSEPNHFPLYTAPDGAAKVPAINKHLKNIFDSGELVKASVISILETTAADGAKTTDRTSGQMDAPCLIAVGNSPEFPDGSENGRQHAQWNATIRKSRIVRTEGGDA
jgi:hypothetical protein